MISLIRSGPTRRTSSPMETASLAQVNCRCLPEAGAASLTQKVAVRASKVHRVSASACGPSVIR